MKVLVTGVAGFIGFHCAAFLLERGVEVVGIDNINDYYDRSLELFRLELLTPYPNFQFLKLDLADRAAMKEFFAANLLDRVCPLGVQARVRCSLENPTAHVDSNLVGFGNILEGCRHGEVRHLTYASSSSGKGANARAPFSVRQSADHPVRLYAATKKANELVAHSYNHLDRLPTTGLRFPTVYGPRGRPDMSPLIFTRKIIAGEPVDVFDNGDHARLHLYRRHRRGRDPDSRQDRRARCGMVAGRSGSVLLLGSLAGLRHRQFSAGGAARLHRRDREGGRALGDQDRAVQAAGRRRSTSARPSLGLKKYYDIRLG